MDGDGIPLVTIQLIWFQSKSNYCQPREKNTKKFLTLFFFIYFSCHATAYSRSANNNKNCNKTSMKTAITWWLLCVLSHLCTFGWMSSAHTLCKVARKRGGHLVVIAIISVAAYSIRTTTRRAIIFTIIPTGSWWLKYWWNIASTITNHQSNPIQ